jgi:hypothetical protein
MSMAALCKAAVVGSACLNPAVENNRWLLHEGEAVVDAGWDLLQVTAMQRHTDRWMYPHDLIGNVCWPGQLNSSSWGAIGLQCDYVRDSAWTKFGLRPDPYAAPAEGKCSPTQATLRGLAHAAALGALYRATYADSGALPALRGCPAGSVALGVDPVQKNERTAQAVFSALCGRELDKAEFPAVSSLVSPGPLGGNPFFLAQGLCRHSGALGPMAAEADAAMKASAFWAERVVPLAARVACAMGRPAPSSADAASLLDNAVDCSVVHSCSGMGDTPAALRDAGTGAPGGELFDAADEAETASRAFPFAYFRNASAAAFRNFSALQYGYYFGTVLDRMSLAREAAVAAAAAGGGGGGSGGSGGSGGGGGGGGAVPRFILQVMSDGNVTPQLAMLGLSDAAARRPPYLSSLVFELKKRRSGGSTGADAFAVRVVYNGAVQKPCANQTGPLCPWGDFVALALPFVPTRNQCPEFWNNWEPKSQWGKGEWPPAAAAISGEL